MAATQPWFYFGFRDGEVEWFPAAREQQQQEAAAAAAAAAWKWKWKCNRVNCYSFKIAFIIILLVWSSGTE